MYFVNTPNIIVIMPFELDALLEYVLYLCNTLMKYICKIFTYINHHKEL